MPPCATPDRVSYLVVGAGVFGASAALALARSRPSESIILVDKDLPPRQSASWDWTKVVRADYTDIFYTRLALEAKNHWRADPLYSKFYHETGLIWVDETGFGQRAVENFVALGADERYKQVPVPELRDAYSGLFRDADFGGAADVYLNESSGWVEAGRAVAAVIDAAVAAGVRLVQANVSALTFDGTRVCTGVRYADGQHQVAEHIILATGAETARLLVCSDPTFTELHGDMRLSAAGLVTGVVRLRPEEAARFDGAPVFLHAGGSAKGAVIPPNDMGELKITCDVSFINTTEVLPGFILSSPPINSLEVHASLAPEMASELARVCSGILGGRSAHRQLEDCYICWDAITPNQDFIISAHPHAKNLYVATGGSFHSFKFLPTIGDFIANMIDGNLPKELVEVWAWDRTKEEASNQRMMPTKEMADLKASGLGR